MNTRTEEIINKYFDGESSKEEEAFMFAQLSLDEEAREYFKSLDLLKKTVEEAKEDFPNELDEKLLLSLPNMDENKHTIRKYFSLPASIAYVISVILFIILLSFRSELSGYKEELNLQVQQVNYQSKMINLLFNSLPPTVVSAKLKNPIIVTPKM